MAIVAIVPFRISILMACVIKVCWMKSLIGSLICFLDNVREEKNAVRHLIPGRGRNWNVE